MKDALTLSVTMTYIEKDTIAGSPARHGNRHPRKHALPWMRQGNNPLAEAHLKPDQKGA